jgi:hypothetical protein
VLYIDGAEGQACTGMDFLHNFAVRARVSGSPWRGRAASARWYLVPFALAFLVFLPWANSYFVADDWPVLKRLSSTPLSVEVKAFVTVQSGSWYRPLYELLLMLCWKAFGLNPTGYHLMSLLLFAVVSVLLGSLAESVTGDRRARVLSAVLFVVLSCHAESVLWISSFNELLAGVFFVSGVVAYVFFRQRRSRAFLAAAVAAYLLALTSKETATFLPLALLAYDLLFSRGEDKRLGWRWVGPLVPFFLVGALFLRIRFLAGSPYDEEFHSITVYRLIRYPAQYAFMEVIAAPVSFHFTPRRPLFLASTMALTMCALAVCAWFALLSMARKRNLKPLRPLGFGLVAAASGLIPVALLVTERTAFISSLGTALVISTLFLAAVEGASLTTRFGRRAVVTGIAVYMATNLVVLQDRARMWGVAGSITKGVLSQLSARTRDLPEGAGVLILGLPDSYQGTLVFRNAIPSATQLLGFPRPVHAVLDLGSQDLSKQDQEIDGYLNHPGNGPAVRIYHYANGVLLPLLAPPMH